MVVRFRGQSDSHSCEFAWTEFAPLRRSAIRSLTTRLNVPVVRERLGQKSERSHKLDHRGLLHFLFSSEKGEGRGWAVAPSHTFERGDGSLPSTRRQTSGFKRALEPGSESTLAPGLTHASRTGKRGNP